jgi:hypothetical protein
MNTFTSGLIIGVALCLTAGLLMRWVRWVNRPPMSEAEFREWAFTPPVNATQAMPPGWKLDRIEVTGAADKERVFIETLVGISPSAKPINWKPQRCGIIPPPPPPKFGTFVITT